MDKKQVLMKQLKPYLPIGFDEMIADLLVTYPVRFAITNPRATKLGAVSYTHLTLPTK
jgi:SprT protein